MQLDVRRIQATGYPEKPKESLRVLSSSLDGAVAALPAPLEPAVAAPGESSALSHFDAAGWQLSAIIKDTPPPIVDVRPGLFRELSKIINRCLARDLEDRYQSAKDLRNDLRALTNESQLTAEPVGRFRLSVSSDDKWVFDDDTRGETRTVSIDGGPGEATFSADQLRVAGVIPAA